MAAADSLRAPAENKPAPAHTRIRRPPAPPAPNLDKAYSHAGIAVSARALSSEAALAQKKQKHPASTVTCTGNHQRVKCARAAEIVRPDVIQASVCRQNSVHRTALSSCRIEPVDAIQSRCTQRKDTG
jgi:hypothetical protein